MMCLFIVPPIVKKWTRADPFGISKVLQNAARGVPNVANTVQVATVDGFPQKNNTFFCLQLHKPLSAKNHFTCIYLYMHTYIHIYTRVYIFIYIYIHI